MSLFDIFSAGLARYETSTVESRRLQLQEAFYQLMGNDGFIQDITYGTSDLRRVQGRFKFVQTMLKGVFGAH